MSWDASILALAPLQIIDGDRGKAYPKNTDYSPEGHCLFLNAGNVTVAGFEFSQRMFISEQKDDELRKGKLTRNDIVLTTRGTLGNVAFYETAIEYDHVRINSGMVILRCDPLKLLPEFLYGYLRSPSFGNQVEQLRSGAAQPQLPIRDLSKIEIPLPPVYLQRKVVDVFSNYDNLIENNRRRMALLEDSARLLYREWFVRLRFPGCEHTPVVDGVPQGWSKVRVDDFGIVLTGKTPSTKESDNYGGDVPFIKTPDMHGNTFVLRAEANLTEKGAQSQANKFLPTGSILVSCIGTVGVVSLTAESCQFNQQINAVVPREGYFRYYCYFALKDLKPRLDAIGGGVTMANVSKGKFESMDLLYPSTSLLRAFDEVSSPVFNQIKNLGLQNQKLRAARDLLLPRMMTGEFQL